MKFFLIILTLSFISCSGESEQENIEPVQPAESKYPTEGTLEIRPVQHSSMVLNWSGLCIYIDPHGDPVPYLFDPPIPLDVILITDIHGDHLDTNTIKALRNEQSIIIAPEAVAEKLPVKDRLRTLILNNDSSAHYEALSITAMPMYNTTEDRLKFHPKGRGNGYLLERNGERVYISGDTEDIPEMRNLENIDVAFICMNLPYTMDINQAAEAVLAFKPKVVYPYHFRGTEGMSDVEACKEMVESMSDIQVKLLDWYPE